MIHKIKFLCMVTVLVSILVVLIGCSKKNEKTKEDADGPIRVTFVERVGREWDKNGLIYRQLEEMFDVKIEIEYVQEQEGTQSWYALKIAAGDVPDYIVDVSFSDYKNYVESGVFKEIPLDVISEYAPDMVRWYKEEAGENIFNLYDIDGKNYALPILWSLGNHWSAMMIREDWLIDVGIATLPQTLDELEEALYKFKDTKNLDYVVSGNGISSFDYIFGAYDVYFNQFYVGDDGNFYRGEFHPNAKEALTRLNTWYEDGLIDREFVTNKSDMVNDKWLTSRVGIIRDAWPSFVSDLAWYGGGKLKKGLLENDSDAIATQIPAPMGKDGSSGFEMLNPVVGAMCFSADISDKKMKKYLEIFNASSQKFDVLELLMQGIEGQHFELTDEGVYVTLPPYDEDREAKVKDGLGLIMPGSFNNYTAQMPFMTAPSGKEERILYESMNIGKNDVLVATYRPVWAEKGTQFDDICEKNIIDFITGARPLDEYDEFLDELLTRYSGDAILQEAEKTYKSIQ